MTCHAPILELSRRAYIDKVCGWLREEVEHFASPVKELADDDTPLGTAKNWYAGTSAPDSYATSRLRARFPNFDAKMRMLEGKQRDFASDFEQILNTTFIDYLRTNPELAQAMYQQFFKHHNAGAAE